ncbi:hypothetical protein BH11BAC3_BH11BAC3_25800 [soil metagenome]
MKKFILKYKWNICFLIIFLPLILVFEPKQKAYYLDIDITSFKSEYLTPVLIWTWIVLIVALVLYLVATIKLSQQTLLSVLNFSLYTGLFLLIFQDTILSGALFINRQFEQSRYTTLYEAAYMVGAEGNKETFHLYDISTNHISMENKLINRLYNPKLKSRDTVYLNGYKGLFGIKFQREAMITE